MCTPRILSAFQPTRSHCRDARRCWRGRQGETAVRIRSLDKDGPAAKGKLVEGDVILSIDGRPVGGVDDLVRTVHGDKIGQAVVLSVLSPRGLETKVVLPNARSQASIRSPNSSMIMRPLFSVTDTTSSIFENLSARINFLSALCRDFLGDDAAELAIRN